MSFPTVTLQDGTRVFMRLPQEYSRAWAYFSCDFAHGEGRIFDGIVQAFQAGRMYWTVQFSTDSDIHRAMHDTPEERNPFYTIIGNIDPDRVEGDCVDMLAPFRDYHQYLIDNWEAVGRLYHEGEEWPVRTLEELWCCYDSIYHLEEHIHAAFIARWYARHPEEPQKRHDAYMAERCRLARLG